MEIQRGGRVVRVCFDNKPQVGWLVVASELHPVTETGGMESVMSALARAHMAQAPDAPPPLLVRPPADPARREVSCLLPEDDHPIHVPADVTEAQALHAIEALRLGVVPRHLIESYTVGRTDEVQMVHQDLAATEEGGAFRVVMGDYGTGKTHHLEFVEAVALSRNFMTARITLDARETPAQHAQARVPGGGQGPALPRPARQRERRPGSPPGARPCETAISATICCLPRRPRTTPT